MTSACTFCCPEVPCTRESYASHSNVFGPSIEELLLTLMFILVVPLCEVLGIVHKEGISDCSEDENLNCWLSKEIKKLAAELSLLGYDIVETGICPPTQSMFQARKFVLNKLAELMEKKDELEGCICKRLGVNQ